MKRWMFYGTMASLCLALGPVPAYGLAQKGLALSGGIGKEKAEELVSVDYLLGNYLMKYQGNWYYQDRQGYPVSGLVHLNVEFGEHQPGFYFFDTNGKLETGQAVHKFKNLTVYGVTFDGYYYHEENGRFYAKARGLRRLNAIRCMDRTYDGIYYIGDYGKLAARERPRYIEAQTVEGAEYPEGWYYFEKGGGLCRERDTHEIHGTFDGQKFDGIYYFGESKGRMAAPEPAGELDGEYVLVELAESSMDVLKESLEEKIEKYDGTFSIYVKNLDTEESFAIHEASMYSASLVKAFVMGAVYEAVERGRLEENEKLDHLLEQMITVSDNEAFNELVRQLGKEKGFSQGASWVNAWITLEGYEETGCHHTLAPSSSASASDGTGERNKTSVTDCGNFLESVYRKECVSPEASEKMMSLLLDQQNLVKIPAGVPEGIPVANKTGETDSQEHDMAIVWGENCTYILCIMSSDFSNEGTAISRIQEISRLVYDSLNQEYLLNPTLFQKN